MILKGAMSAAVMLALAVATTSLLAAQGRRGGAPAGGAPAAGPRIGTVGYARTV